MIGSLDQKEAHWPSMELAAAGIPVLSVHYRLCLNGVHYPAPQDDVLTAWQWAMDNVDQLGVDPARLHLGGASAGACLVAGAALRLRDTQQQMPASLFLAYPVLEGDPPSATPAMTADLSCPGMPTDEWVRDMFANWSGDTSWDDPYVCPGRANLRGLPPAYVLTCARDMLRRSSEPYVDHLREAGVQVWQDIFATSQHAPLDRPDTTDGQLAIRRLQTWLTDGLEGMSDRPAG